MKRLLSVILCALMMFTLVIPAFAEDVDPDADAKVAAVCCIGDINADGFVGADDARLALRFAVGLEPDFTEQQIKWANYVADEDGIKVLAEDARMILRVAVKLEEQKPHGELAEADVASTWLTRGYKGTVCADCERVVEKAVEYDAVLEQVINGANAWADNAGLAALVTGLADVDNASADIIVDVDGIWAIEDDLNGVAFDGFMTAFGNLFREYVGEDKVVIVDKTVYEDGKFQNSAIKGVLFEIGAGLFYKLANLNEDLVFGSYAIVVGDEAFTLNVKLAGDEANIAKVKDFAATIASHISATVVDNDLVIDIKAPDKLVDYIETLKPEDPEAALNSMMIFAGLSYVESLDVNEIVGSQASAVNRLCAVLNSVDGFVNKVLEKVTSATVTTMNGQTVDLLNGNAFAPEDYRYSVDDSALSLLIRAAMGIMSDDLLMLTVGDFANEDGYYTVQLDIAVDMENLGGMVNNTIEETIYINIHVFDDVDLG